VAGKDQPPNEQAVVSVKPLHLGGSHVPISKIIKTPLVPTPHSLAKQNVSGRYIPVCHGKFSKIPFFDAENPASTGHLLR
jgi:hypothetical protein